VDSTTQEINASAFDYSQSQASQIIELAKPFLTTFGLTTFIYGRLLYDGRYIFLSTEPEWVKNWYQNIPTISGTSLHTFFQNVPLEGKAYYALWSTVPQDYLVRVNNRFGLWHGFDVYYRLTDSVEGWSFSTSNENSHINQFYLNHLHLLNGFCLYFREKAASLLDISDKRKLAIFQEPANFTYEPSPGIKEDVDLFLSSLFKDGYPLLTKNGNIHLSKRELDCMFYLSQGRTSKEIGRLLGISHRTVDTHMKNIKLKSGNLDTFLILEAYRNKILRWL